MRTRSGTVPALSASCLLSIVTVTRDLIQPQNSERGRCRSEVLMRSRMFIAAAVIFAALSSTNAQKVTVDVDRTFDFKTFKTYSWAVGQIAPKATTGQMLIAAVERE